MQKAAEGQVPPTQGVTLADKVVENLFLERHQIAAYTAFIREIREKYLTRCHIFVGFLTTTDKHASGLADYLKHSAETR